MRAAIVCAPSVLGTRANGLIGHAGRLGESTRRCPSILVLPTPCKVQVWVDMPAPVSDEYRRAIGRAIKEARKERGMSQDELRLAVGNSKNAVSNWERGVSAPTAESLRSLCVALNVAPQRLLVMNGTTTAEASPASVAARMLAEQLADLRKEAQAVIPDLMGVLAKAEQTARGIADR